MTLQSNLILAAGIFCLATALFGLIRPVLVWDMPHEPHADPGLPMVRRATLTLYVVIGVVLLLLGAL